MVLLTIRRICRAHASAHADRTPFDIPYPRPKCDPCRPPCSAAIQPLIFHDSAAIPPLNDVIDRSATFLHRFCQVSAVILRHAQEVATPRPSLRSQRFCRDSTPVCCPSAAFLPFVTSSRESAGSLPVFCRISAAAFFAFFTRSLFFFLKREKRGTAATRSGASRTITYPTHTTPERHQHLQHPEHHVPINAVSFLA